MCSSCKLLPSAKTYKAWVGHIFLWCGSKSQKLLMSLEGTKPCRSFDSKADKLQVGNKILPYKKALLRIVPIKGIWVAIFKTCSNYTGLLPRRACLYHYYMCSSGTLLPSSKTYKAWVGHIFLWCGSKSQKLLMSLEGTKTCGSFGPRADKLLAGLDKILPYNNIFTTNHWW